MGRLAKMAAAVGAVAVALLGSAGVAVGGTAPPAGSLLIRSVDTRTYGADGKVSLVVEADLQSSVGGYVSINGVAAKNVSVATTAQALSSDPSKANKPAVPTGIVFVVDTSKAMNDHEAIAKVAEALSQLTQLRQPNQEWALISYGVQSRVVSAFTSDPAAFAVAAGRLTAATREDSAPWDGLRTAL
ncbi:MAG: hypothetical protein JWL70_1512, partial [Acidimicrobiia bacterium]|nr:hypothetical protein [Acidimicrobiia bacterium]